MKTYYTQQHENNDIKYLDFMDAEKQTFTIAKFNVATGDIEVVTEYLFRVFSDEVENWINQMKGER